MSDPPPRKVGSLRDRIAAFENKGPASTPAPAPAPRPKPGHIAWQPKAASPPTSPRRDSAGADDSEAKRAGMSAADAMESIGKLSLRERMAALQGSAAFGGPAPGGPPPRPTGEKPKWKPPPVVQRVEPIGGEDEEKPAAAVDAATPAGDDAIKAENPEEARSPAIAEEAKESEGESEQKEQGEPDPEEEEERQRRAALAARMARLGGARVGMAPPIFGKKPDIPPKKIHKEEEKHNVQDQPKEGEKAADTSQDEEKPGVVSPSVQEAATISLPPSVSPEDNTTSASTGYFPPARKGSDASSLLSPESLAPTPPVRSPAMPVPQAPKRAAPPRKRPAKSPSPAPAPVIEQELQKTPSPIPPTGETTTQPKPEEPSESKDVHEDELIAPHGDREPEVTESQVVEAVEAAVASASAKEHPAEEAIAGSGTAEPEAAEESHVQETSEPAVIVEPVSEELVSVHEDAVEPATEALAEEVHSEELVEQHRSEEHSQHHGPEPPVEEPEEDETARRKRIAERLAKSGGFNPFAGGLPPPAMRRDSADSMRSPPPPMQRDSQQEALLETSPLSATSPKPELPERKASVGSVQSGLELPSRKQSSDDGGVSAEPHAFEHSTSAPALTRETHAEPIKEVYEDEDEATATRVTHEVDDSRDSLANEQEDEVYYGRADHEIARGTQQEEPETIEEDVEESILEHTPLPPAPRLLPTALSAQQDVGEDDALSSPPPRMNFPPPPARAVVLPPTPHIEEYVEERTPSPELVDEGDAYARHAREVGPEHEEERHMPHDEEDEQLAQYSGEQEPYWDEDSAEHEDQQSHDEYVPPPPPPRRTAVPPPPPPAPFKDEEDIQQDEPVAPTPPPRRSSANVPAPPPTCALPLVEYEDDVSEDAESENNVVTEEHVPSPPPRQARPIPHVLTSPPVSAAKAISPRGDSSEQEVFDDSDVDPIDPGFYSPQKSAGSSSFPSSSPIFSPPLPPARVISPPPVSSPPPPPQRVVSHPPPPPQRVISPPPPPPQRVVTAPAEPEEDVPSPASTAHSPIASTAVDEQRSKGEDEEDTEQARRRTIAERMAKLGGIRFGAPPPIPAARRPPPPEPEAEADQEEAYQPAEAVGPEETLQEEEDEFARKQRIAARIAGMGGMRFGMLPGAAPSKPAPRVHREEEDVEDVQSPAPPKRSAPALPPPLAEDEHDESDYQHVSDSDHVGHEESEMEEVTYTDAEEEEAPPIPDRSGRRVSTGPPPVSQVRPLSPPSYVSPPPIPRTRPSAPPAFTYPPPPQAPPPSARQETQGDFVIVDKVEDADEPPPPPPPRAARPPPRAPPRAPPAEPETAEETKSAPIPNIDFGGETDLSLSSQWSEDSAQYPPAPGRSPAAPAPPEQPPSAPARSAPPLAELHLTPDELQTHWGRVGIQVHEIAASYYEKSKKHVVGDGSYVGFVHAVLSQVPNAAQPTESLESFGYLVYSQAAAAVQRRISDIMPGDVIVVYDAKFKGHKGLQSYNQTVGVGDPLVGIVSDFEVKKSKVKVYQANQHVGQQSVESVSYRLEDLKSGSVKIFRVLEA